MKKYRQYLALIIILSYLLFLVGCGASQELAEEDKVNINAMGNEPIITEFYYSDVSWDTGIAFGITTNSDGDVIVNYLNYGFGTPVGGSNDVYIPLTQEKYAGLVNIIKEYDLASWDGWGQDKEEQNSELIEINVGAGGFKLEIHWSDGTSIMAKTEVPYPENYQEVSDAIERFFNYYLDDWKKANNIE